jgi:hypothetical protein
MDRATTFRGNERTSSWRGLTRRGGSVFAVLALAVWGSAPTACAEHIYSGVRSTANADQVVTDDEWSTAKGGFTVTFAVEWTGSAWKYDYTFADADGSSLEPPITRFLKLEVSDVSGAWYKYVSDGHTPGYCAGAEVPVTPSVHTFHLWDAPESAPAYSLCSLFIGDDNDADRDELADGRITILSSQGPKWGSFYARDGDPYGCYDGPAEAVNRGFNGGVFAKPGGGTYSAVGSPPVFDPNQNMNGADVKHWILVPDTQGGGDVPEPGMLVLVGWVALAAVGRRQVGRQKQGIPQTQESCALAPPLE